MISNSLLAQSKNNNYRICNEELGGMMAAVQMSIRSHDLISTIRVLCTIESTLMFAYYNLETFSF